MRAVAVLSLFLVSVQAFLAEPAFEHHAPVKSHQLHRIPLASRTISTADEETHSTKLSTRSHPVDDTVKELFMVSYKPHASNVRGKLSEHFGQLGPYLPHHTFLVYSTHRTVVKAEAIPGVTWTGVLSPRDKLSQSLLNGESGTALVFLVFPGESVEEVTKEVQSSCLRVLPSRDNMVVAEVADGCPFTDAVHLLSHVPAVISVDKAGGTFETHNRYARGIAQSGDIDHLPYTAAGLEGEGEIIGVGDTGLDALSCFFLDADHATPYDTVSTAHRKLATYVTSFGDGTDTISGHGTHVVGVVAGAVGSNSKVGSLEGGEYDGLARGARVAFVDLSQGGNYISPPSDMRSYFDAQLNAGARISLNAWGRSGRYPDGTDNMVDLYTFSNQNFLPIFAGGDGSAGLFQSASPGTAKNALSVGASFNGAASWDGVVDDREFMSPDLMSAATNSGPTYDLRFKPDVFAPGYRVQSARPGTGSVNCDTQPMEGSSQAAAVVAGMAAIISQYFRNGYYPTGDPVAVDEFVPTAALLKAVIINSGENLLGAATRTGLVETFRHDATLPDARQGFGRAQLSNVLPLFPLLHNLFVDSRNDVTDGASRRYCFRVTQPTRPFKVTLVWTDPPPFTQSMVKLVNDLDLTVSSGGRTFLGNHRVASSSQGLFYSTDYLNNVEQVSVDTPPRDSVYTVVVTGTNIPSGPQPYALVVSGVFETLTTCPQATCLNMCGGTSRGSCGAPGSTSPGVCRCNPGFAGADCSHSPVAITTAAEILSAQVSPYAWIYYKFAVFSKDNDVYVEVRRTSGVGDPDIYIRHLEIPTLKTYDYYNVDCDPCGQIYHPIRIPAEELRSGSYYIGIYGYCCDEAAFDLVIHDGQPGMLAGAPGAWTHFARFSAAVVVAVVTALLLP